MYEEPLTWLEYIEKNMNTIQNVGLQVLGVGFISTGAERVLAHDYIAGGILCVLGIACYLIYEFTPIK